MVTLRERMAGSFVSLSPDAYLKEQIRLISEDTCKIQRTFADGSVFVELNEEYLREVAPLLGDLLKIKRVMSLHP